MNIEQFINNQDRPAQLTSQFFPLLMSIQCKREGIFQLVEFYKKRHETFSARINDGFFRLKILIKRSAAQLLQSGKIEIFSIIQANLQNHGEGAVFLTHITKYWHYKQTIGFFKDWKLNKVNINKFGNNIIQWNIQGSNNHKQQLQPPEHINVIKTATKTQSLIKVQTIFTESIQKENKQLFGVQNSKEQPKSSKVKKLLIISSTQDLNTQVLHTQNKKQEIDQQQDDLIDYIMAKQSKNSKNFDIKSKKSQKTNLGQLKSSKKVNKALNDIIEDNINNDCDSQSSEQIFNRMLLKHMNLQKSQKGLSPLIDNVQIRKELALQLFTQQRLSKSPSFKKRLLQMLNSDKSNKQSDQSEIDLNWITKQLNKKHTQPHETVKKNDQVLVKDIINAQQKNQSEDSMGFEQFIQIYVKKNKKQPEKQKDIQFKKQMELLIPQIHTKLTSQEWWIHVKLIAKNSQNAQNSYFTGILKDKNENLIEAKIIKLPYDCIQEDQFYKIKGAFVRSSQLQRYRGNIYDLQIAKTNFNSLVIRQCEQFQENPNGFNYCPFSKINDLREDILVNVVGVIKNITLIKTKLNKYIANYQIIDPVDKISINMVDFNPLQTYNLTQLTNVIVSVFNAKINLYRNKKSLATRFNTVIRYGFCQLTPHFTLIRQFLQTKDINQVQIELNFKQYKNILQIKRNSIPGEQLTVSDVQIIELSKNCEYVGCDKCKKKLYNNICKQCGPRSSSIKRIFIIGSIIDWSGKIQVNWGDEQGKKLLQKGYEYFKEQIGLKNIRIWLVKGQNEMYNVRRFKILDLKEKNRNLLQFIKQRIVY